MSTQGYKARPAWGSGTRREHPVPGVAPRESIEGFRPEHSPKTLVTPDPHKNTRLHQLVGNSANGHATTSQKLPTHPVNANPDTPRPSPVVAASWGMTDGHRKPHDSALGDAVLQEAAPCGGKRPCDLDKC